MTFQSELIDCQYLAPGVKVCRFPVPENFSFKAGQYISVTITDKDKGRKFRRPYSIVSQPSKKDFIEICFKRVIGGVASNYLYGLKVKDKVELFGPAGRFVVNENSKNKELCFICTGTGITPFISMIHDLLENGFKNKMYLVKGFRTEDDILYDKELNELKKSFQNLEFFNVLSQPKNNFKNKGYVQDFLKKFNVLNKKNHYYICGLTKMIEQVKDTLIKNEIPEENIFFEKYD